MDMNPASAWKVDIMYNGEWLAWGVFKENAFFFSLSFYPMVFCRPRGVDAHGNIEKTTIWWSDKQIILLAHLSFKDCKWTFELTSKVKEIHHHAFITSRKNLNWRICNSRPMCLHWRTVRLHQLSFWYRGNNTLACLHVFVGGKLGLHMERRAPVLRWLNPQ